MSREAILYTDGAVRGNPGPAGIGVYLYDPDTGETIADGGEYIGVVVDANVAEYRALIRGLEIARTVGVTALLVHLDSELVLHQVTGQYRAKNATLIVLRDQVRELMRSFRIIHLEYTPRAANARADARAQQATTGRPDPALPVTVRRPSAALLTSKIGVQEVI